MAVNKTSKTEDYRCPTCSAPIKYSAKLKKWDCEYCGNKFTLEELKSYNKSKKLEIKEELDLNYVTYICKDCGAEIIADSETTATFCLYCGNTAILKNKLVGKFAPDLIIPFKKDKDVAINAFKNITNGRPLAPKDFNNEANIEKIKGVYIPFWLYDINVDGNLLITAKNIKTWRSGDYINTKTDIYSLIRDGSIKFIKVPVDGSTRFDNDIMNTLEPFNYEDLEEFDHGYLSGFFAEKFDQEADELYNIAANRAVNSAKYIMSNDSGYYTTKTITEDNLRPIPIGKKYALLPVWMVNVKYKDKMHIFAMNGQTGEFIGNIPLDKTKAWIYGISIFVGVIVVIIVGSYLLYKMGGGA